MREKARRIAINIAKLSEYCGAHPLNDNPMHDRTLQRSILTYHRLSYDSASGRYILVSFVGCNILLGHHILFG